MTIDRKIKKDAFIYIRLIGQRFLLRYNKSEAAKAIFLKYFSHMADSLRMQEMMGVSSIDRMSKISQLNIPKEILPVINMELNEIPKN